MQHTLLAISDWLNLGLFTEMFKELRESLKRHAQYRSTVDELSKLTDKELNDIGINRGMIHSIAMEMYYDNR